MDSLFKTEKITFDLPNSEIEYFPNFYNLEQADKLYKKLHDEIPWQQDDIKVYGKIHPQPRLTSLFGNEGKPYSYSNIVMKPHAWNELLIPIKEKIELACNEKFTTVLLNLYRNGRDSNGWHADNEKELGKNPVIASLSFGEERSFHLQYNLDKSIKQKIVLQHGSLLIMKGETQHYWKHQILKPQKKLEHALT